MSFQLIRAHIEERVNNAFQAIVPAVPVVFDNVQETPPDLPYVVCLDQLHRHHSHPVCLPRRKQWRKH